MLVCQLCRLAAPWGAFDETLFDEIWLVNVLNCAGIFAHRCRNRIQSYWSAADRVDLRINPDDDDVGRGGFLVVLLSDTR